VADYYPQQPSVLQPRWASVLGALALTGLTFAILPFFGALSQQTQSVPEPAPSLPVDVLELPPETVDAPMPRETDEPEMVEAPPTSAPEAPELAPQDPPPAPRLQADLSHLRLSAGPADVGLGFHLAPPTPSAQQTSTVFGLADLDRLPLRRSGHDPAYPWRARQRSVEGKVVASFVIDAEGRVRNLDIEQQTPRGVFDAAVRRALASWRFEPGTKDGRAVPVRVRQVFTFSLADDR
jgi:protein TonB